MARTAFDVNEVNSRFFSCFPDLSQPELAEVLKVKQPTISQWQTGRKPVSWNKLRFLVETQNISWNWLLDGVGPPHRTPCCGARPGDAAAGVR